MMKNIEETDRVKFYIWVQHGLESYLETQVSAKKRLELEKWNKLTDMMATLLERENLQDKFNEFLKEDRITNRIYGTAVQPVAEEIKTLFDI